MKRSLRKILILAAMMVGLPNQAAFADSAGSAGRIGNSNRRITLNVPKGDIREALRLVAEQGGLNISIGPGVEGEVSVFLTDATLDGALQSIAVDNGYQYKVENNIISVARKPEARDGDVVPPLAVRVFTLRCQDAERVRDALEFALTKHGKMKVLNENSTNDYMTQRLGELAGDLQGTTTNGSASAFSSPNQNALNPQQAGLATQTSSGTPRNARRLVVTDVAENLNRIADLIADLDQMPPQVLIEARIVEMSTDLQRELGIDWDVNVLANGPVLNHELPLQWEAGFAGGSQIRRSANGRAHSSAGLSLGTVDLSQVTALLRIHQSDNAIRLLANPRLLVFNNHSASILVGERYPILTANITDFGTVTESFDTYIPVGVQLEVTPTIMVDGRISLMVHPQTSALGDDVVGTTGLHVARIRTRELNTRVVMNDGQTIALGGLISDRNTRTVNKVPGLGDMWGLSTIFRQERPHLERVDLLCFLTAHVEGADAMTERDREVFSKYEPHFKEIQKSQDVQLHFEVPTEYEPPKPMFGDPVPDETMDDAELHSDHDDVIETRHEQIQTKPAPLPPPLPYEPSPSNDVEPFYDTNFGGDPPLTIEKTRFDLMRTREKRDRRMLKETDKPASKPQLKLVEKEEEHPLARERIIAAREKAGLKSRNENQRREENTFARPGQAARQAQRRRRVAQPNRYGVDAFGRPLTRSNSEDAPE